VAGLACGALWTVSRGINSGDIVLCPDGGGRYRVGEVTKEVRAEDGQAVQGVIIALDDDAKIRMALAIVMAPTIDFYRYKIEFKLLKAQVHR